MKWSLFWPGRTTTAKKKKQNKKKKKPTQKLMFLQWPIGACNVGCIQWLRGGGRNTQRTVKNSQLHWNWEFHSACHLINTLSQPTLQGPIEQLLSYHTWSIVFLQPVMLLWVMEVKYIRSVSVHTSTCKHVSPTIYRGQWRILVTSLTINLGYLKETPHNCNSYRLQQWVCRYTFHG